MNIKERIRAIRILERKKEYFIFLRQIGVEIKTKKRNKSTSYNSDDKFNLKITESEVL